MNPYPTLLGINWAIENQNIINFKKRILSFEDSEMQVVSSIDPSEGQRYVNSVRGEFHEGYLDNIYNISYTLDDYINPTIDGKLSRWSVISCSLDSGEALENW